MGANADDKIIRSLAFVIESSECVLKELPDELRGPTFEELRGWRESDRQEAKR